MFFSLEPKMRREDLYDRENELNELEKAVENGRIVLLTGVRRIGKTSILKVFLNEKKQSGVEHVFIDCRAFIRRGNLLDKRALNSHIVAEIQKILEKSILKRAAKSISNIKTPWLEVDLKGKESLQSSLARVLDEVNSRLERSKRKLIVAMDEVQNMRLDGSGGLEFLNILAYAYDHLSNIEFILTGSEVGVLHDFLRLDDAESPLFGRYLNEIQVERFSQAASIDFLVKGFEQLKLESNIQKIEEAVDALDGLVGYLVMYGYTVWQKKSYDEALSETLQSAVQIIKKELQELFERSENYKIVLEAIAHRMNTFSKIKEYSMMKSTPMNDRTLTNVLKSLVKYSYLEERFESGSKYYAIPDPIVERAILKID
ncbi:AAA family ATPase [Pseudothermotoga sp. U03pept]|uniref:AAA family ATPase n=1 Tax=Pseudothermotoga sp. U03pept TaxID=3447012 RepID=UPI003F0F340B